MAQSRNETPSIPHCRDYLRTGKCKYGESCKYQHPADVQSGGGMKTPLKPGEPLFPIRPSEPPCQYFLKHGSCKFGQACKFNHPEHMAGIGNFMSKQGHGSHGQNNGAPGEAAMLLLPQRHNEPDCIYFLRNGRCKYGATCKYHHPLVYTNIHQPPNYRGRSYSTGSILDMEGGRPSPAPTCIPVQLMGAHNQANIHTHSTSGSISIGPTHILVTDGPLTVMVNNSNASNTTAYHLSGVGQYYGQPSSNSPHSSPILAPSNPPMMNFAPQSQKITQPLTQQVQMNGTNNNPNSTHNHNPHHNHSMNGNHHQNTHSHNHTRSHRATSLGSIEESSYQFPKKTYNNPRKQRGWASSASLSTMHTWEENEQNNTNHRNVYASNGEEWTSSPTATFSTMGHEPTSNHTKTLDESYQYHNNQVNTHHHNHINRPNGEEWTTSSTATFSTLENESTSSHASSDDLHNQWDDGLSKMTSALLTMLDTTDDHMNGNHHPPPSRTPALRAPNNHLTNQGRRLSDHQSPPQSATTANIQGYRPPSQQFTPHIGRLHTKWPT